MENQSTRNILIATGNRHKTEEIRSILGKGYAVSDLIDHPDLPEVEETGVTFLENAQLKAVGVSKYVDGLVLADDSGLEVDTLDGAPGVHSARYAGTHGDNAANNTKLLEELSKLPESSRPHTARFQCAMVIAENGEELAHFSGNVEGRITDEPDGSQGFGYDPLFIPNGFSETFAQLGDDIKNSLSHRGRAMAKVIEWLKD